jgi:glycosyltransferase involved in cell wall biosynthesis
MPELTVAVCTYNRANLLAGLILSLSTQKVDTTWEILVIDNNSSDDTSTVLRALMQEFEGHLRTVIESNQGIAYARNRAIEESMQSNYLLFIDDDELPASDYLLQTAVDALRCDGAMCVGGKISFCFESTKRPAWLVDELLGFLGKIDYGPTAFWIRDKNTPVWSGIVAYNIDLFKADPTLRFSIYYNRAGRGIGGGEDRMMFLELLQRSLPIRYEPSMEVIHFIEPFKLKRCYFLKLHYLAGVQFGRYESANLPSIVFGVPLYMIRQSFEYFIWSCITFLKGDNNSLRQWMTFTYSVGALFGKILNWKDTHTFG